MVPISLLKNIQQDIATLSVACSKCIQPPEYSGWITENDDAFGYTEPEMGTEAQGASTAPPDGAFAQYHSHPPYDGIPLLSVTNATQDFASTGLYRDVQRWTNTRGEYDFLAHGITGAVVFGPTGAYAYDLRTLKPTDNPSVVGVQVLSGSQVSWPNHVEPQH
jgi:hypothetical protein